MPPHATIAMKRKLDDFIEDETYGTQRQSVLHMSVSKLKGPRVTRVDPGLRRWVLILNTLKHIENELQSEGVNYHPPQDSNFISNTALNELTLDPLPDSTPNHSPVVSRMDIVTLPKCVPKDVDMLPAEEKEERTVLDLLPCRLPSEYSSNQNELKVHSQDSNNNNVVPFSSSLATPSPHDLSWDHDPLHDIDISVCDFDFSTFSNSVKLAPLSPDDVLHTFPCPSHDSASSPLFNTQCGSFCKTDHFEDLDNIIQILVGM